MIRLSKLVAALVVTLGLFAPSQANAFFGFFGGGFSFGFGGGGSWWGPGYGYGPWWGPGYGYGSWWGPGYRHHWGGGPYYGYRSWWGPGYWQGPFLAYPYWGPPTVPYLPAAIVTQPAQAPDLKPEK
jgi:hypothetical protein